MKTAKFGTAVCLFLVLGCNSTPDPTPVSSPPPALAPAPKPSPIPSPQPLPTPVPSPTPSFGPVTFDLNLTTSATVAAAQFDLSYDPAVYSFASPVFISLSAPAVAAGKEIQCSFAARDVQCLVSGTNTAFTTGTVAQVFFITTAVTSELPQLATQSLTDSAGVAVAGDLSLVVAQ